MTLRLSTSNLRFLIAGTVLVGIIAGMANWLIAARWSALVAESFRRSDDLAQVLAEQTARTLQPIDLILQGFTTRLTALDTRTTGPDTAWNSRAMFELLAGQRKSVPAAALLYIIGSDGEILNSSRGFPSPSKNISHRGYFQYLSTHDDHALIVSPPMQLMTDGTWVVFLARRINDVNSRFAGLVVAGVTLSYLEDFYKAVTPENGSVGLLLHDGKILVRYPPVSNQIELTIPAISPWHQILQNGHGSYRSAGFIDGEARLVSVRSLRDFPLTINVTTLEAAVWASWYQQALQILLAATLAGITVICLLWIFSRQVSQLQRQNKLLEWAGLQFEAVLDNISQGLTFFDENVRLMICNRRFAEIYDLLPEQIQTGMSLSDLLKARLSRGSFVGMPETEYLARRHHLAALKQPFDITDELSNGRTVVMHFQPLPSGGWVTTHEDITESRRANADLAFLARHDALTQLPNRTLFHERLAQSATATQHGQTCALLCIDLDRFKIINDTLGHPTGDALLIAVADRLLATVRDGDTVARLGGDEFAVIQADVKSPENAAGLAERIIATLQQPYEIDGHHIVIGASVGISIAPQDGLLSEILMKNADIALYVAKAAGRATYRMFEPALNESVRHRQAIELELRNALVAQQFELHYQPIVDLGSGQVISFEALLRWNHPARGMISPAEFIPIAEETGLIIPLGAWALETACKTAANWPEPIEVAVNLSPAQFKGTQLVHAVSSALGVSGLSPNRLELEITESVLMQTNDRSLVLLGQLRALGVRVALDDFGTGYSSLSYLRSFPFEKIKIDQAFIRDINTNRESTVIVGAMINLARNLNMVTVAEGVETIEQLATLQEWGCTRVQGYLFSPPCSAADVPAVVNALNNRASLPRVA